MNDKIISVVVVIVGCDCCSCFISEYLSAFFTHFNPLCGHLYTIIGHFLTQAYFFNWFGQNDAGKRRQKKNREKILSRPDIPRKIEPIRNANKKTNDVSDYKKYEACATHSQHQRMPSFCTEIKRASAPILWHTSLVYTEVWYCSRVHCVSMCKTRESYYPMLIAYKMVSTVSDFLSRGKS